MILNINKLFGTFMLLFIAGVFLFTPNESMASTSRAPLVKVIDVNGNVTKEFNAFDERFRGGATVAVADVTGDGKEDIVVAAGPGGGPHVRIFSGEGVYEAGFFAYDLGMRKGVNVAAGDLDGDGVADIVTVPMSGARAHVRIFRADGTPIFTSKGFSAYDPAFRGGAQVAVGDLDGDGYGEIITGAGPGGGPHVRVFNRFGEPTGLNLWPFEKSYAGGVAVSTADVNGDGKDEIITTPLYGEHTTVGMYSMDGTLLSSLSAYPDSFKGGGMPFPVMLADNAFDNVGVGVYSNGGPQVRVFANDGRNVGHDFFTYENDFRGGVRVSAGDLDGDGVDEFVVVPGSTVLEGRADLAKYIEVDISEQRLRFFENGRKVGEHVVSTGKWSMPTPLGTFKIQNHIPVAYSRSYALYMDWWMAVTPDGAYGIHALPYWKLAGGGRYYEGTNHLGIRVSHGCIRQSIAEAKELYDWAQNGTPVIIHQ